MDIKCYFRQTATRACENLAKFTALAASARPAIEQATAAPLAPRADGGESDSDPFADLDDEEDDDKLVAMRLFLNSVKLYACTE